MSSDGDPPIVSSSWRFSLRTVLLVFAFVAIVLAPYRWFGATYLASLTCSMLLVAVCSLAATQAPIVLLLTALGGMIFGGVMAVVFGVFAFHAFLNFLACIVLAVGHVRAKAVAVTLSLVMIMLYALAICVGANGVRNLLGLKEKYSLQSVEERLSFEHRAKDRDADENNNKAIQLASGVSLALDEHDGYLKLGMFDRSWALQQLHENTTVHFARAAGFGVARMPSIEYSMRVTERRPLFLPMPVVVTSLAAADPKLMRLHDAVRNGFFNRERFGYVRSRREVAGFHSHQLEDLGTSNPPPPNPNWYVTSIQLVSLLRHAEPRVYEAANMPAMDKLADVPHRALNQFESQALPRLLAKQDVVTNAAGERIQMLGALRAGTACLQCHEGERGKLLGAFSYELVPISGAEELSATSVDQTPGN
jgi:hypothetical protein